ncbi:TlpA family protein disulfide reductase [Balneola sp. MJW-20]|uniref:TlpA family protein disulfide reductase n=1 Tax=Gracilimonas aurantiaca TaxID=3234185 RepID=UPI003465C544
MHKILILLVLLLSLFKADSDPVLVDADAGQILAEVAKFKGDKPVMVNFWATWCAPCVEEFPYMLELYREYDNDFALILVSGDFIDQRDEALEFLKDQGVNFTSYFKKGKDNDFIRKISNQWTGALPFTIIYDMDGNVSTSWEGKADKERFESELLKVLNPQ